MRHIQDCEVIQMLNMETIRNAVHEAVEQYPVKRVDLFGSYADGTASEKSDIDFLVEFNEAPVSLFKLCGFQAMLSDLLKIDVDVVKLPLQNNDLKINKTVQLYES